MIRVIRAKRIDTSYVSFEYRSSHTLCVVYISLKLNIYFFDILFRFKYKKIPVYCGDLQCHFT